ncbi:MAG TPA: DoxX family protein [Nitrolancea sp.]|nr:DoxX family protein [Nitrolancea sp.]
MELIGYLGALVLAAVLALGAQYLFTRSLTVGKELISLFVLGFIGVYAGSELFGEFGDKISSLSAQGPSFGGFYVLTGLVGGLIMVAATAFGFLRQQRGLATDMKSQGIADPKIAHIMFNDSRVAALWLGIRLYVGYEWLAAGYHKWLGPGWMDGGSALKGFWTSAVAIPQTGSPRITYGWYREFLTYMLNHGWYEWFAKLITVGEMLVGIGLIVGALVGIAAFFGALMNFSFMLAGSASTNPVLLIFSVGLILAWKVAGYWGIDRYLLPELGAPWSPGKLFEQEEPRATAVAGD